MANRKTFVESLGATCKNWNWSWSFINEREHFVLFGVWDIYDNSSHALILSRDWQFSAKGRKQPGYTQAIEHLEKVENDNYSLKTFKMVYSEELQDANGFGPARIGDFEQIARNRQLRKLGENWFAASDEVEDSLPEQVDGFWEGEKSSITIDSYERDPNARKACLKVHGYLCMICAFDFEGTYGDVGKNFIHVHHIKPISSGPRVVDPTRDLVPVCPNCHAIIHRSKPHLTLEEVKAMLREK